MRPMPGRAKATCAGEREVSTLEVWKLVLMAEESAPRARTRIVGRSARFAALASNTADI
jgi:hypothetical protein